MSTNASLAEPKEPRTGIGAAYFLQETDLLKLEYAVNDLIESQLAEGIRVLSVELTPVFQCRNGISTDFTHFATITVAIGDQE